MKAGTGLPAEVYAREFVHPDDAHLVAEEVNRTIAATDPNYTRQIEHRIIRRDGEIRHIVVRIAITKDAEGRTVKTHGANQDITERKQAEYLLREEQEFSKSLIDSLPGIFYLYTYPGHKLKRWNKLHETLFGFTAEEMKRPFCDGLAPA